MKLRVKLSEQPQVTHKAEVLDSASLYDLAAVLHVSIPQLQGLNGPDDVRISLNKKVVLSEDSSARLSHLGICSGDTLWVLTGTSTGGNSNGTGRSTPAVVNTYAASTSNVATVTTVDQSQEVRSLRAANPAAAAAAAATARAAAAAAAAAAAQATDSGPAAAVTSASAAGPSDSTSTAAPDTLAAKRIRRQGDDTSTPVPPANTSPLPTTANCQTAAGTSGSHTPMNIDPPMQDHGAGSEGPHMGGHMADHVDDFMGEDAAMEQAVHGAAVVPQAPAHLLRVLAAWSTLQPPTATTVPATTATTTTSTSSPQQPAPPHALHQLLLLAAHAAMSERGFQLSFPQPPSPSTLTPSSSSPLATTQPSSLQALRIAPSGVMSVMYLYRPHAAGVAEAIAADVTCSVGGQQGQAVAVAPAVGMGNKRADGVAVCELKAVAVGPHLVIHVTVKRPLSNGGVRSLSLDTRTHVAADAAVGAAVTGRSWAEGALGSFQALKSLWVQLQDDLVTWAVHACCMALGREPPGGLMGLPHELRMVILSKLPAVALARVTCTCVELRHWGGDNSLWEPLFRVEFPSASLTLQSSAAQRGWQTAYGAAWKARQERERARRLMARMGPYPMQPGPRPDPSNPFIPQPHPGFPGNVIGGDYDRFPALPHFPGMPRGPGGGMFMGGGVGLNGGNMGPMGGGFLGPRQGQGRGVPAGPPQPPVFGTGRARGAAGGLGGGFWG